MSSLLRSLFPILLLLVPCLSHAGLDKALTFSSGGEERTYSFYAPNSTVKGLRPLVILLHGHYGSADVMTGENKKKAPHKIWMDIADREGLYLVIPDGEKGADNHRGWNDCRREAGTNPNSNDAAFIDALVDSVSAQYPIDQERLYVNGTSNGGIMSFRLAQERGAKYKAIAAVVASMPKNNKCTAANQPISVLIMNGTKDPLLPYEGGAIGLRNTDKFARGSVMSTDDAIKYWVKNNKAAAIPAIEFLPNVNKRDRSRIQVNHYKNGANNTEVVLYKVIGGGHTEPSLTEHYHALYKLIVGRQNRDVEMAEVVWAFFDRNQ